ncbi:UNVERIFIED_CONTAM: putrescine importer [Brevibacillus sp. OAP136]
MSTPTLNRRLTLFPLVLFGLATMAPGTVFTTIGIASQVSEGMLPASYIFALLALLFTAYSYSKMVQAFPIAGSAYSYTQKSISPHMGFLVGWVLLTDYLFLPMVNYLIVGIFLSSTFPSIPKYVWIILIVSVVTFIAIRGNKGTTKVNFLANIYNILIILFFCILSIRHVLNGEGTGTLFLLDPLFNPETSFSYVLAGASLICFSFLGFDSVTTLAEETVNPKKNIPRAIFIVVLFSGSIFILVSYIAFLVKPDFNSFQHADSAVLEIAKLIGGNLFMSFLLAKTIAGCFGSGLSSHASVARVLYAMGRDGVLPKKVFGYIHPKFQTPSLNILIVSLIALSTVFIDLGTIASFINYGALIAFMFVNLSVISHYYMKGSKRLPKETFLYLILPLIGLLFNVWLITSLDIHSIILGSVWTGIGIIYLVFLTNFFRRKPPEMYFDKNAFEEEQKSVQ